MKGRTHCLSIKQLKYSECTIFAVKYFFPYSNEKKKKAIANHNLFLANSGAAGYVLPQWKAVKALEYIFIVSFH